MTITEHEAVAVLFVDDEPDHHLLLDYALCASDAVTVVHAYSGAQGLASAQEDRPDVIIADVVMPGMDGFQMAYTLSESDVTRDIPIIFLTARARQIDVQRGKRLGAVGYITKPFDPSSLETRILDILRGSNTGG
jgi:putative two-component system response regulator